MRGGTRRLRTLLFLGVGIALTAVIAAAYALDAMDGAELNSVDARFSIRGDQKPPKDMVLVLIDDVTFNDLAEQWPFDRSFHAKVIDRIIADNPKAIAYDVQFSEPGKTEKGDVALANSLLNSGGKVVLSFTETDKGKVNLLAGGQAQLDDVESRAGNGLFPTDPGGVIRKVAYQIDKLKSLSVVTYEVGSHKKIDPGEFTDGKAWIDYYGGPGAIPGVSFSKVFQNKLPRGFFKDKYVVVGPLAPTLQDLHPTSTTGSDENMAGAEIQANALATVRRGLPLRSDATWINYLLIVALGMLAPLASLRLSPLRALALAVLTGVAYAVAAQLLFNHGTVVAVVYPLVALILTSIGALAIHYVTAAFERERVRDMFSRFVPENVVGQALEQADGARLGGVGRTATVMFSDLRGFTSFAESLEPDEVITILNRYLTAMVDDAIDPYGGTLVDYMGDGIMAVFGAPIEMDDHADRALAAARAKLVELEKFNEWLRTEKGYDRSFQMGIGLNSGRVMSGNVGSERRLAYTAIGDTTNTAARLEALTKDTPHMLFLAESTRALLSSEPEDLIAVGDFEVRGREQRVKLWSVTAAAKTEGEAFASVSKPTADAEPGDGGNGDAAPDAGDQPTA